MASRARPWTHPSTGEEFWFDVEGAARLKDLELLAEMEEVELDDLLDANLSQREVHFRLNKQSGLIPPEGLEHRKRREKRVYDQPTCAICSVEGWECEGRMTRHHFVPKWMMLELTDYEDYAPRNLCTVWVCAGSHRWLHLRRAEGSKSIVPYLDDESKEMAHRLVGLFRKERPRIYALIAGGDKNSYEWQLVKDWRRGLFDVAGIGKQPFPRWKARAGQL